MLHIKIICIGKQKFLSDISDEYTKRLSSLCKLEIISIQEEKLPQNPSAILIEKALLTESEKIMQKIPKNYKICPLCIEGTLYDSEKFSAILDEKICFIIGGSHGLSDKIKEISDNKLSMSKMTFPHHLAKIMLLEQIYRGFTIKNGSKYHK